MRRRTTPLSTERPALRRTSSVEIRTVATYVVKFAVVAVAVLTAMVVVGILSLDHCSPTSPAMPLKPDRAEVAAALGVETKGPGRASDDAPNPIEFIGKRDSLRLIQWRPGIAKEIVALHEPIVLVGSPADAWTAMRDWTPAHFTQRFGASMQAVHLLNASLPFVYVNPEKPLMPLLRFKPADFHVERMSVSALMRAVERSTDQVYFSCELTELTGSRGGQGIKDCHPLDEFVVSSRFSAHLWVGAANVTAHTHYDAYANFYVQLEGRKRWSLIHPQHTPLLQLYPYLHPSARQSQIDIDHSDFPQKFVQHVTLYEGDVLYIPPFTFHRVRALSPSFSVNIWSDSSEMGAVDESYATPLPFESDWPPAVRSAAVRGFFARLLCDLSSSSPSSLSDNDGEQHPFDLDRCVSDLRLFAQSLFEQRYAPLLHTFVVPFDAHSDADCHLPTTAATTALLAAPLARNHAAIAAPLRTLSPHIRHIVLGNFLEETLQWAVGAQSVAFFLHSCF